MITKITDEVIDRLIEGGVLIFRIAGKKKSLILYTMSGLFIDCWGTNHIYIKMHEIKRHLNYLLEHGATLEWEK